MGVKLDKPIHPIVVEPFGDGWALRCPHLGEGQLFRSFDTAGRAARQLAGRLALAGQSAEVRFPLPSG